MSAFATQSTEPSCPVVVKNVPRRAVASVFGGGLLITAGALVRIPVPGTDVPMTLQLLAVLLTGLLLSPARAVAATMLYLACGAAGLPVFAGAGGLVGPTGGYLVGFVVAAWAVSVLRGSEPARFGRLVSAVAVGSCVVFAMGLAWRVVLIRSFGFGGGAGTWAVSAGLWPFLPKALVEMALAVTLVVSLRGGRGAKRRPLGDRDPT